VSIIKKYHGYLKFSLPNIDFLIARNPKGKFHNVIFDLNKSMQYYPNTDERLDLYFDALQKTNMIWTDNIYKQFRVISFIQALDHAIYNNPKLSFVELGVWKGLSAYITAKKLVSHKLDSELILIDSFEGGLSEKKIEDKSLVKNQSSDEILAEKNQFYSTENEVRENLSFYNNLTLIPGWVPQSIQKIKFDKIAFVHFDMDLYEPTLKAFDLLWPNVASGGVVVFDDHNSTQFPGVQKAFNEISLKYKDDFYFKYEVPFGSSFIIKK